MEEQLVEILDAIQEVTPEIATQAVAYGRLVSSVWIAAGLIVAMLAATICCWCWKHWGERDYLGLAILSGCLFAISLLAIVCATGDLIGSYIAPDYYAAEAIVRLFRLGVH